VGPRDMVALPELGVVSSAGAAELSPQDTSIFLDADSLYWLHLAQRMRDDGLWRVRHIAWDNAPHGRVSHWASIVPWILNLGSIGIGVAGRVPEYAATLLAGRLLNPLLFAAFLLVLAGIVRHRLHPVMAGALLVLTACLPALRKDLSMARIDHHGLADIIACLTVLLPVAGGGGFIFQGHSADTEATFFPASRAAARRWFIAGGVLGGVGLWLQAPFQALVLAALAAGATLALLLSRKEGRDCADGRGGGYVVFPECWRAWGVAGCVTSLVCYAVEYLPGPVEYFRLEVNQPLYGLCWLAGGEFLTRMGQAKVRGHFSLSVALILGLLGACTLLLPLLIFMASPVAFVLKDPLLLRVHSCIGEFRPFFSVFAVRPIVSFFFMFGILPCFIVFGFVRLVRGKMSRAGEGIFLVAAIPALAAFFLCMKFNRFAGLASILAIVPAAVALGVRNRGRTVASLRILQAVAVVLTLVVASGMLLPDILRMLDNRESLLSAVRSSVIMRDVAREIGGLDQNGGVMLAGFDEAAFVQHYANCHSTGALYWENSDGIMATVDFFAAYDAEEAKAIAAERRVEYILLRTTPEAIARWHFCRYGYVSDKGVKKTMAYRLAVGKGLPPWLEPVCAKELPLASQAAFRLYRVKRMEQRETS